VQCTPNLRNRHNMKCDTPGIVPLAQVNVRVYRYPAHHPSNSHDSSQRHVQGTAGSAKCLLLCHASAIAPAVQADPTLQTFKPTLAGCANAVTVSLQS
jgi:hypothetical protein